MKVLDRLLTIVVTVTLTSAFWIVAGGSLMERANPLDWDGTQPETREVLAGVSSPPSAASRSLDRVSASVSSAQSDGPLAIPVAGVNAGQLSDTYSDSRSGGERLHEAIDIMAARGTPVVAAAAGKVEKLFQSDAGGLTIYIRSPDGRTIHYYAHLDSYAPGLAERKQVRQGEALGTVGSTGNASPEAPHLHFAVMRTTPDASWWEPANAVNPYPLLKRN